jgi:hypothetical protein
MTNSQWQIFKLHWYVLRRNTIHRANAIVEKWVYPSHMIARYMFMFLYKHSVLEVRMTVMRHKALDMCVMVWVQIMVLDN